MLEVKLFGTGQAQLNQLPVAGFPGKQAWSLFCYLLLTRHYPQHRDRVSAVFWGDQPTQIARKRLRSVLWGLKKDFQKHEADLNDYFLITDTSISFLKTSPINLDIAMFEKAINHCQDLSGQELVNEWALKLEQAIELYTGDLLEGVYEDWLLHDRERYRLDYLNTLSKLLVFHGLQGNFERGLMYGERILALDNTREKVHRQMMWLSCLLGDRNAALEQYQRCCRILRQELGIPPMEETQSLYERIRSNQYDPKRPLSEQDDPAIQTRQPNTLNQTLLDRLLRRLNRLQQINEESSAELRHLKRLIHQANLPTEN